MTAHMIAFNKVPIVSYGFLPTLAKHLWRVPKLVITHDDYIKSQNKTVCFNYKENNSYVTANSNFIATNKNIKSNFITYSNINNIKFKANEFCYYSNYNINNVYINYELIINTPDNKYVVNHKFNYSNLDDYILNDFHVFLPGKIQMMLKNIDTILEENARHIGVVN